MKQAKWVEVYSSFEWQRRILIDNFDGGVVVVLNGYNDDYLNNKEYATTCCYQWREIKEKEHAPFNFSDNNIAKEIKEPEYIPFSFKDDLLGKRVKHKDGGYKELITVQIFDRVNKIYSYEELLKYFTFIDGSPCGKIKE